MVGGGGGGGGVDFCLFAYGLLCVKMLISFGKMCFHDLFPLHQRFTSVDVRQLAIKTSDKKCSSG